MNPTATQRFTDTLLQLGFLHRNRHREFMLGTKVLSLGFAFLNGSQLKKLAETYIAEYSAKMGRTINMGVLDGEAVVFLCRHQTQTFINYDLHAGSRLPSHCTATGKVLLAALPDKDLQTTLSFMDLKKITRFTITDPELMWEDLMETRKRGYSVCDREFSLALLSFGVPVLNLEGRVAAAVNISLSADETKPGRNRAMAKLQELGRTISNAMGYEGEYPVIPV
jgi:IclR family pca regulon transcriptional regulator